MVGQNYVRLLAAHPWFKITDLAASPLSAGKTYLEAVQGKWIGDQSIPKSIEKLVVRDTQDISNVPNAVQCVFSAMDLPEKSRTADLEFKYAAAGYPIVSNSSANRWTADVPILIPEINPDHINIIPIQQKIRGFKSGGFVVAKPNCSIQSFLTSIYALEKAGYPIDQIIVTTLQALSGGGYKTISSKEMVMNVIPYIGGEEAKTEFEPSKVMGRVGEHGIENDTHIAISATCIRVPVIDGHTASISLKFMDKVPSKDEIVSVWRKFRSVPQKLRLPFAPEQPIIYSEFENRPQPQLDVMNDKGMALTIGRLREDSILDYKYVALSHNTLRGAAGGAILAAEYLVYKGFIS